MRYVHSMLKIRSSNRGDKYTPPYGELVVEHGLTNLYQYIIILTTLLAKYAQNYRNYETFKINGARYFHSIAPVCDSTNHATEYVCILCHLSRSQTAVEQCSLDIRTTLDKAFYYYFNDI